MVAETTFATDVGHGSALLYLSLSYEDAQKTRLALAQRGMDWAADMEAIEKRVSVALSKELRRQPIWPWLSQFKGLGGVHTARLIAYIDDPHRFPREGRPGTGVRSLWHYCGLHVVDGKAARKRKGQQCDWNPKARTALMMPMGIAHHIVQHRVEPYRGIYDQTKERLQRERGVDLRFAADKLDGPALASSLDGPDAADLAASGSTTGLRPIQIHNIARTVAVKAFLGDLLMAMKAVYPPLADLDQGGKVSA